MAEKLTGDYRKFMDKNYLGSWDVPDGEDLILTISSVEQNEVQNQQGREIKLTLHFVEDYKPLIMNATNCDRINSAYGSPKVEDWVGKRIALTTEKVPAFGSVKDAVRIRPYPPRETEVICEDCGKKITAHGSYSVNKIVTMSKAKYGANLCWDCSVKRSKEAE
jgi:hypothetical protein